MSNPQSAAYAYLTFWLDMQIQPKAASSAGPRSREPDIGDSSQRLKNELPETWYSQFIEKYRVKQPYRLSHGNSVADKRTSEEMSSYLSLLEKHKKRRMVFKDDLLTNFGNSVSANTSSSVFDFSNSVEDDANFSLKSCLLLTACQRVHFHRLMI